MNHLEKTRETYQQIAADYAQAQLARGPMTRQIEKFLALLPPGGLVLDVGCGPGMDTAVFQAQNVAVVGLDFSHEMMRVGRDTHSFAVPFIQGDMRRLPFASCFAGLWAFASLLHLGRDEMLPTLREFYRVLQPSGVLYLSVKEGSGEKWEAAAYGHPLPRFFTYWQAETLDPLLKTAAFHIIDGWEVQGKRDRWLVRYVRKEDARQKEPGT